MAASSRVICVQIERQPEPGEETPEQRLEAIAQCLQKAEEALDSGDLGGFFDYFKSAIVNKTKDVKEGVIKRVQDLMPGYKIELPDRFFDEMDMLVKFIGRIALKLEQPCPHAPTQPSAPVYYPPPPARPPPPPPPAPPPSDPVYYPPPPPPPSDPVYYPPPPPPPSDPVYYPPPPAREYYPPPPPPAPYGYYAPPEDYAPSAPPGYAPAGANPVAAHPPPHAGHPRYYLVKG